MLISKRVLIALMLCCFLPLTLAFAKEGSDAYPQGAENWSAGAVPPPGFYYVNYFMYYHGELKNGGGDSVSLGGKKVTVDAEAEAMRFLLVPNFHPFKSTYAMHIIVPVVHQNVTMGADKGRTGVGDIDLIPFALTWHAPKYHQYVAFGITAPTGHFNPSDARVSIGTNYWQFTPIYAQSYLPPSGWEISSKWMYDLHTRNSRTQYSSGQEFHVDYLVGKHFGPAGIAAAGYFVKQTTDDTVSGVKVAEAAGIYSAGRRGQTVAIGPSFSYTTKQHISCFVQYGHEMATENRFGGDRLLFKVAVPVSALTAASKK